MRYAVAVLFVALLSACGEPEPILHLDATVRKTGTQLVLLNNEQSNWMDCEAAINPGALGGGFKTKLGGIKAGQSATAGLMTFTKDAERFNPFTHAVERVSLDCRTPEGRAFWNGRFD